MPSSPEPTTTRRRGRIFTPWNVIRAVLVLILVTELGLRLIFDLGNPVLYLADDKCGYLVASDQHVYRFFAHNDINHFHMRSEAISEHKLAGHYRVLFVGDSVLYGTTFVDQSKIFTTLLANDPALPRLTGHPVEVLNASTGGWAVSNEVGFVKGYGTFDADLIILVMNTGDINQTFAGYPGPPGFPDHKPLTAIGETWVRYLKPRLFRSSVAVDPGALASSDPQIDTLTPQVLGQLTEVAKVASAHGARFVLVYSPARGTQWDDAEYQRGLGMVKSWANDHKVPLVDMSPEYAPYSQEQVYFDTIHLRPFGHQLVANRLKKEWPTLVR